MTLTKEGYMPRIADQTLSAMLRTFGAVCIEGPRGCGKTWTGLNQANSAFMVADPGGNFSNRAKVSDNVEYALSGDAPHLIDEWQEFPSIWDATMMHVDRSGDIGRFILTGSSTPEKGVHLSGDGRIGTMTMRTMSLFESGDSDGAVSLSGLFRGEDVLTERADVGLERLSELIVRGGWPCNLELDADDASMVMGSYLELSTRVAYRMGGGERSMLRTGMFVRSLARNESTVASDRTVTEDITEYDDETVPESTVTAYSDILRRMFLTADLPAFGAAPRSPVNVCKRPKRHLTDPSLAAAAMGVGKEWLMRDRGTMEPLFESLCARDLSVYAEANGGSTCHYRDDEGREVDAVVRLEDGRWGAFEIRTGTDGIEDGACMLRKVGRLFESQGWQGPEFLCVLCGTAPAAYRRGDGVYVVPVAHLGPRRQDIMSLM